MVETQSPVRQRVDTERRVTYSLNTSHLQIDLKDLQFLSPLKVHPIFSFQPFKVSSLKADVFPLELIHLSLSPLRF